MAGADWCTVCYAPVDGPGAAPEPHIGLSPAFKPYEDVAADSVRAASFPPMHVDTPPPASPAAAGPRPLVAALDAPTRPPQPAPAATLTAPEPAAPLAPTWTADAGTGLGWDPSPHNILRQPPPYGLAGDTRPMADPEPRGEGVFGMAMAVIGLGVVLDVGLFAWGESKNLDASQMIADGLFAIGAFYVLVAGIVLRKARRVAFRPVWTEADPTETLVRGLVYGGGVAVALLLIATLLTGHLSSDSGLIAELGEHSLPRTLASILITCVAAPWVEELLFRGLLAESWRERGIGVAAVSSGVLFAVWHPQALFPLLAGIFGAGTLVCIPFLYYVAMGAMFGRVYLKHGLKCSIAAHTAFNGMLVLAAFTVLGGSTHTIETHGVRILAPSSWEDKGNTTEFNDVVTVLEGPSGATVTIERITAPDGVISPSRAAELFKYAMARWGDPAKVQAGVTRLAEYPMGEAVHQEAVVEGHTIDFVLVVKGTTLYDFMFESQGSGRAQEEFEDILRHTILPDTPV